MYCKFLLLLPHCDRQSGAETKIKSEIFSHCEWNSAHNMRVEFDIDYMSRLQWKHMELKEAISLFSYINNTLETLV